MSHERFISSAHSSRLRSTTHFAASDRCSYAAVSISFVTARSTATLTTRLRNLELGASTPWYRAHEFADFTVRTLYGDG